MTTAKGTIQVRAGYVPLTDAANLIVAAERGFAEEEGLELVLEREVSWANIRDKLILNLFDAAHMLAPFAIATSLGLGHVRVPLAAPFALNLNGNAITVSLPLFAEMSIMLGHEPADCEEAAQALGAVVSKRRRDGRLPLNFGIVFPFSTHTYLLRHWLAMAKIDLEHDVQLVVVPPPYMVESLRSGLLDGFCVGSPWNTLAVQAAAGSIAAFGVEIEPRAPEKVLAVPQSTIDTEPETIFKLLRALHKAALWSEAPKNRDALAELLARPQFLDVPASAIRDGLEGNLRVTPERRRAHPDFLILGREKANRPDPLHAKWLYEEMVSAGQAQSSEKSAREAVNMYRSDIYDAALG